MNAEQTVLSGWCDRCSVVSIGSALAACHLSHLRAYGGDPQRALQLHTLSALTQSNTDFCWGGGRRGQDPEHKESQPLQPLWPPTTWSATLIYKWVTFATTAFAQGQLKICVLKGGLTRGEVLIMKGSLRARPGLHMGTLRELVHDPVWGKNYSYLQLEVPEGALLQLIEVLLRIFHQCHVVIQMFEEQ